MTNPLIQVLFCCTRCGCSVSTTCAGTLDVAGKFYPANGNSEWNSCFIWRQGAAIVTAAGLLNDANCHRLGTVVARSTNTIFARATHPLLGGTFNAAHGSCLGCILGAGLLGTFFRVWTAVIEARRNPDLACPGLECLCIFAHASKALSTTRGHKAIAVLLHVDGAASWVFDEEGLLAAAAGCCRFQVIGTVIWGRDLDGFVDLFLDFFNISHDCGFLLQITSIFSSQSISLRKSSRLNADLSCGSEM